MTFLERKSLSQRIVIELKRKALHLFGLTIPVVYAFFGWRETFLYALACLIGSLFVEAIRLYIRPRRRLPHEKLEEVARKLDQQIESIARKEERTAYAAHIPFFVAALFVVSFFEKDIVTATIISSLFGDAAAAVVGMSIGRHTLPSVPRKTWEGAVAGGICAFLCAFSVVGPICALVAAFIVFLTDFIDLKKLRLNDNLVNPTLTSILMFLLKTLLG